VGCGARDGAPAEAGERPAWRALDHLAQSPPAGQEARPRHPIQPGQSAESKVVPGSVWPQAPRSKPSSGSAKSGIICL
jgi:hypothetical protein